MGERRIYYDTNEFQFWDADDTPATIDVNEVQVNGTQYQAGGIASLTSPYTIGAGGATVNIPGILGAVDTLNTAFVNTATGRSTFKGPVQVDSMLVLKAYTAASGSKPAGLTGTQSLFSRGDTIYTVTSAGTLAAVYPAAGGSGETNTMSNITGSGVGVYKSKTSVNFDMKRLKAVTLNPLTITDATDSVMFSDGWTYSYITTNQSNNTRGTPTALWAISLDASSKYQFEGMTIDTGAATTTGTVFYISASGTVAGATMIFETNANTTLGTDQQAADQCLLTSSTTSDSSVFATRGVVNPAPSYIKGIVRTNANARTFTIGYKTEISASAVVQMAGTYIRYRKLPY
jgi:hypothetical protein